MAMTYFNEMYAEQCAKLFLAAVDKGTKRVCDGLLSCLIFLKRIYLLEFRDLLDRVLVAREF